MDWELRVAAPADVELLVELIGEFYAESGYAIAPADARRAFAELVAEPRLGRVWIVESAGQVAGYLALTLGFSLEYLGRDAFIDDFFLRPPFRDRGIGTQVLERVEAEAERLGILALHLEVERANDRAQAVYRRRGFRGSDRQLLSKPLTTAP